MLRRQLLGDVVTAALLLLGLAVGLPLSMLFVLLVGAVPVTALVVIRNG